MKPKPEANPIFHLEWQQDQKSGFAALMLMIGLIAGFLLLIQSMGVLGRAKGGRVEVSLSCDLILLLVAIAVPLHAAYKLVSQKQNCDLELYTAMSSGDILWGKLYRCLYLLGHLYGPTVPGLLVFLVAGEWTPLAIFLTGFVGSICLTMIVLGFLAGTRSSAHPVFLVILAVIFTLGLYGLTARIFDIVKPLDQATRTLAAKGRLLELFVWTLCSLGVFRMGILLMNIRPTQRKNMEKCFFRIQVATFILIGCVGFFDDDKTYISLIYPFLLMVFPWVAIFSPKESLFSSFKSRFQLPHANDDR